MTDTRVVSEPLTYSRYATNSYFRDLMAAEQGSNSAKARLKRHAAEVKAELERRDERARISVPDGLEVRANPDRLAGQGGSFSPPLWLIDQFATAPRARRILADMIPGFALPQGAQSVAVPRLTTGTQAQPVSDRGTDPGADIVDAQVTSPVVTISGHGDVPLQLLEQSPAGPHLDWAMFKDLTESYDAQLEAQLINGTGTGGQLLGVLNVSIPAANSVTYTDATPTAAEMFPLLGQMVAAVGNNRKIPPEAWLMTTSRFAWLASGEDNQLRPLMLDNRNGAGDADLLAFPIEMDDAVPANLGATSNQDRIALVRPSDMLLLESTPRAAVMLEVLSGTLQARLHLHVYVAALVGRYPSGISVLSGTGTVVASGF